MSEPPSLRQIGPGVHIVERPQRFFGLEIGARMTVLQVSDGLLVHSPVDVDPKVLNSLGAPRWVLAPNKLHHLYAGPWIEAGLEGWAAPGLPHKRPDLSFAGVVQTGTHPFGPDVEVLALSCFSLSNEVVLFHKPSRTLVVSDLVFNFSPTAPWLTRAAMWCSCAYPGCRASLLERVGMKRAVAREELRTVLGFGFERIVMAHGEVITSDARQIFAHAYRWLGLRP